jgi:hypothetical protein
MPQRRANPETLYKAAKRPPGTFGYAPIHDFWNVLHDEGPMTIRQLYQAMLKRHWRRPRGGELTLKIMQIDVVSMAKPGNGFAERMSD